MEKVFLHRDTLALSQVVVGYWRLLQWGLDAKGVLNFIQQHLDLGITSVDHADIYGAFEAQALFGQALKIEPSVRQKLEIVTKCGIKAKSSRYPQLSIPFYDSSTSHIMASAEQSLRDLNTDYIDLLLIHRPDFLMDADGVAEAFERLKQAGKVRFFGVSNFTASQFELLQSRLPFPLITNQLEISPLCLNGLNDGTLDQAQRLRCRPMAWSALGGGRLLSPDCEQSVRVAQALLEVGAEHGIEDISLVAYAWVSMLPSKPVILTGSGRITRIEKARDALGLRLSHEQWYRIWKASTGHDVA